MELVIGLIIGLFTGMVALVLLRRKPSTIETPEIVKALTERLEDLGALKSKVDTVAQVQDSLRTNLSTLESKMVDTSNSVKDSVLRNLGDAQKTLSELKGDLETRRQMDRDLRESTKRIERVIVGGRTRGKAGENILTEALRMLPPNIVEANFKVKGHVVEYALVLADNKRVPVDSKWPSAELLERLEEETDITRQAQIIEQIEAALNSKAAEVAKYIDPSVTIHLGIAAVPDAAFYVCRHAHLDAFQHGVVLMPYSLAVVYLLSLYHVHLQYCRTVDIERLEAFLTHLESAMQKLDSELENRISRGATMINNAFTECKRLVGEMRSAAAGLRSIGSTAVAGQLPDGEPDGTKADEQI
ncbi:MAG: DNA recombination protein RmuC [Chloroflexi bacterium]|nr:DNA recombination protein RmuC [Chloroflexota bacterium]